MGLFMGWTLSRKTFDSTFDPRAMPRGDCPKRSAEKRERSGARKSKQKELQSGQNGSRPGRAERAHLLHRHVAVLVHPGLRFLVVKQHTQTGPAGLAASGL
ncbi:MAG: hypothetical protein OEL53_05615 [Rhodospirillales bacterium]|nr:hypothetical protein [Rhodospirillales bacterium]